MKVGVFFVVALLFGLVYYIINYHSPFQTVVTDPYFVEIRVDISLPKAEIQLVGFGKMNSYEDCQVRALLYWTSHLKDMGRAKIDTECKKELPNRYLRLFENEQAKATYVAYDKGEEEERDGRFLIYGLSSGLAYEACQMIVEKAANSDYSGRVHCVKGSVGSY